jgi:uncharacterized RmlC-like cupin family protein
MVTRVLTRSRSAANGCKLNRYHGEEFIYVLSGRVEVHTEYYEPVTLNKGEFIYMDSNMGHTYFAGAECEEACFLQLCLNNATPILDDAFGAISESARLPDCLY